MDGKACLQAALGPFVVACEVWSGSDRIVGRPFLKLFTALCLLLSLFTGATPSWCQQNQGSPSPSANPSNVLVERVGDTAFIQLHAPSFQALSPRQQALAYWLTQASIAIDPIAYDQFSAYGLRQKRLLEGIVAHSQEVNPLLRVKIAEYAKLFWANRGNHNDLTSQKFLPGLAFEELARAAASAQAHGAFQTPYGDLPPIKTR